MTRLIDADALLEKIERAKVQVREVENKKLLTIDLYDAISLIINAPAIEQGEHVAVVDEVAISVKGEHIFNGVGKVNVGDKLYVAPPHQQWVSVDDRLPDEQRVLIKTTTIGQAVASRSGDWKLDGTWGDWHWGVINDINIKRDEVTHWMPLPTAPTEKELNA